MIPGSSPAAAHPWGDAETPYLELGGDDAVHELVESFYDIIEAESPTLREMLPANTAGSRLKLYEYMSGWLGGPPLYTDKRGHPQLRARHLPFPIGPAEAVEWLRCMGKAMSELGLDPDLENFLTSKLTPLAHHMANQA
jgi:hemoglobin